jgi:hypothetical protein
LRRRQLSLANASGQSERIANNRIIAFAER